MERISDIEIPEDLQDLEEFQQTLLEYDSNNAEQLKIIIDFFKKYPLISSYELNLSFYLRLNKIFHYIHLLDQLPKLDLMFFLSHYVPPPIVKYLNNEHFRNKKLQIFLNNYSKNTYINEFPYVISEAYDNAFLSNTSYDTIKIFIEDDIDLFINSYVNTNINSSPNLFNANLSVIQAAILFRSVKIFKYLSLNFQLKTDIGKYLLIGGDKEIFRISQSIDIDFSQILQFAYVFRNDELYDYLSDKYPENKVRGLTGTIRCMLFASQFPNEAKIVPFLNLCALDKYSSIFNHISDIKIISSITSSIYDDNVLNKIIENNTISDLTTYCKDLKLLLQIVKTEKFYSAVINDPKSIFKSSFLKNNKYVIIKAIQESLDEERYIKLNEIAAKNEISMIFDPDFAIQFLSSGKFTDQSTLNFLVNNIDITKIGTVDELIDIFCSFKKWRFFYEIIKYDISDENKLKMMGFFAPENTKDNSFDNSKETLYKVDEFFFSSGFVRKMAKPLHILYFAAIFKSSRIHPIYFIECLKDQNIPSTKQNYLVESIIKSDIFQNTTSIDETIDSFMYIHELYLFYETITMNKEQFSRIIQMPHIYHSKFNFISDEKYMKYYDFDKMPINFFKKYAKFNKEIIDYLDKNGKIESFLFIPEAQKYIDFDLFLSFNPEMMSILDYIQNHIFEKSDSQRLEEFFRNSQRNVFIKAIQLQSQLITILNPKLFFEILNHNMILLFINYPKFLESIYSNWPDDTMPQKVAKYFLMFPEISYKFISNQIERISIFPFTLQIFFPLICNLYSSNEIFERIIAENVNKYKDFLIDTLDFIILCNCSKMSEIIKHVVENYKLDKVAIYYGISRLIINEDYPTVEFLMKKFNYNYDYALLNKLTIPQMIDIHIFKKKVPNPQKYDVSSDYNLVTPQILSVLKRLNGMKLEEYFRNERYFQQLINYLSSEKIFFKVAACILIYSIKPELILKRSSTPNPAFTGMNDAQIARKMRQNYEIIYETLKKQKIEVLPVIDDIINGRPISDESFVPYDQLYILAYVYDNIDAMKQLLTKRNYMEIEINTLMKSPIIQSIIDHKFEIFKLIVSNISDPINAVFRDHNLISASIVYDDQQSFDYLLENNLYNLIPNNYSDPFLDAMNSSNPYYARKLESLINIDAEEIANPDCVAFIKHLHDNSVEMTNICEFIKLMQKSKKN